MSKPRLPRWLQPDAPAAGALDHIGAATGVSGWVMGANDNARQFHLEVVARGVVIARARNDVHRPDLSAVLKQKIDCGFAIPWSHFDIAAATSLAAADPEAAIEVFLPEIDAYLPKVSNSVDLDAVRLGDCVEYMRKMGLVAKTEPKQAPASSPRGDDVEEVRRSGLFDAAFYAESVRVSGQQSPIEHYLRSGEALGLKPNPLFDPKWYGHKYLPGSAPAGSLLDYIRVGEAAGRKPCPVFEPRWYAATYDLKGAAPLAHYLGRRGSNQYNPNPYFDIKSYRDQCPDIARDDLDGFHHWLTWGVFEGRTASDAFNPEYVWRRYLGNNRAINPFVAFMDVGADFGWRAKADPTSATAHRQIAISAAPGPHFEPNPSPIRLDNSAPKVVAFYLPQYHAIPENDRWWGTGFTEWTNLARGAPRFEGHIQPRIPRDLGFYALEGLETLRRQIALARDAGVHGFCFYYYNFGGQRLLERPLEAFLAAPDLDFPFCLMWANENWTRRWDGSEHEVLIEQSYEPEAMSALVDDIARHMRDPRYMRTADGRPLLFVYRADAIPNSVAALERWRERFRNLHGLDPVCVMSQSFGAENPEPFGYDGAVEFPPHKLGAKLRTLNGAVNLFDPDFDGTIRDYGDLVTESMASLDAPFPLIKTTFPSWDNDARRQGRGMVFTNSTPKAFQDWMARLLANAQENRAFGEALVFVNAWNEWCEGAYLEPDTHYGFAYLNALARAFGAMRPDLRRIVLVGHDAFPAGAQHLLLYIGATLKRGFGSDVRFVLIGGGEMAPRYREIADTFIADEAPDPAPALRARLDALRSSGFNRAIVNTVASGAAAPILDELGYSFCALVHELPTLIRERGLELGYADLKARAAAVVYPSAYVRDALDAHFGATARQAVIQPQGVYKPPRIPKGARAKLRAALSLKESDKIILNVGYADLRKGVDLFVGLAEQVSQIDPSAHFVWVGDVHPHLRPWLDLDLQRRGLANLHFVSFADDLGGYFGAADLFLSTSREDPFPSVVIEALQAGLPVAAFEGSGGHAELLASHPQLGALLPFGAGLAAARRIVRMTAINPARAEREALFRRQFANRAFDFRAYCARLLALVAPRHRTVSVVVPNYNYARFLRERLDSIFAQTYPVLEIIVLDDASDDDSLDVARAVAERAGRDIEIERRGVNSGNVFRQWKAGLDRARGDFVWIAEADDSSDPRFLSHVLSRLGEDEGVAFCFTDSMAIDESGAVLHENYKGYYRQFGDRGLDDDRTFRGVEFLSRFLTVRNHVLNASSVVWRAQALRDAFLRLGDDAFALRCAGDWRLYVEATRTAASVGYVAAPLNRHRRHAASVTHVFDRNRHYEEILSVQTTALNICKEDGDASAAKAWREELRRVWHMDAQDATHAV